MPGLSNKEDLGCPSWFLRCLQGQGGEFDFHFWAALASGSLMLDVLNRAFAFQIALHVALAVQNADHVNCVSIRKIVNPNCLEPCHRP